MGDGWETKRKRDPGYDWVIVKLGHAGLVKKIEVDTAHFKGNYPDQCSIEACYAAGASSDVLQSPETKWNEILPKVKLEADKQHFFESEINGDEPATHIRLNIYPDGGVSRLRVLGVLE